MINKNYKKYKQKNKIQNYGLKNKNVKMFNFNFKEQNNDEFNYELIDSEPIFANYILQKYGYFSLLKIRFNRVRYNGDIVEH